MERVLESTTDTAGERPHVEGRRQTLSKDHALPSWEGLEDRMEIPQQQQSVKRQPGSEESGRPIRDNTDWKGHFGVEYGRERRSSSPPGWNGTQKTVTVTGPKRPKN